MYFFSRSRVLFALLAMLLLVAFQPRPVWTSQFVAVAKDGSLQYHPDAQGNILPDFSRVGYYGGDKEIPAVAVVKELAPTGTEDDAATIQAAIDEVAKRQPDANGFRGAILLKKGVYKIPVTIRINASGIVLRGEGDTEKGTRLVATFDRQDAMIAVRGSGQLKEITNTNTPVTDKYVPTGSFTFTVSNAAAFKPGDKVILYQGFTQDWVHDLKMDQIVARDGTKQWEPKEYALRFERVIKAINGNTVTLDNPVMMPLEKKYTTAGIYKYEFDGRISNIGIEQLYCESVYKNDTAENHSWQAIYMDKMENGWVRNVTSRYFANSCVSISQSAKNITVTDSKCLDPKSVITGGRRYSFNVDGQLNLVMNCHTTEGRHDYVTGARVCGPNVFTNCSAAQTHADIGPHHRWAVGTLYDNIKTDGEINVQDRGNWGSGHGWAGVTQIVWNCDVKRAAIQNPWVSGKNYAIGLKGEKYPGRFKDRPDGEWEGQNKEGLQPASLYQAQLKARKKK